MAYVSNLIRLLSFICCLFSARLQMLTDFYLKTIATSYALKQENLHIKLAQRSNFGLSTTQVYGSVPRYNIAPPQDLCSKS